MGPVGWLVGWLVSVARASSGCRGRRYARAVSGVMSVTQSGGVNFCAPQDPLLDIAAPRCQLAAHPPDVLGADVLIAGEAFPRVARALGYALAVLGRKRPLGRHFDRRV